MCLSRGVLASFFMGLQGLIDQSSSDKRRPDRLFPAHHAAFFPKKLVLAGRCFPLGRSLFPSAQREGHVILPRMILPAFWPLDGIAATAKNWEFPDTITNGRQISFRYHDAAFPKQPFSFDTTRPAIRCAPLIFAVVWPFSSVCSHYFFDCLSFPLAEAPFPSLSPLSLSLLSSTFESPTMTFT